MTWSGVAFQLSGDPLSTQLVGGKCVTMTFVFLPDLVTREIRYWIRRVSPWNDSEAINVSTVASAIKESALLCQRSVQATSFF